MTDFNYQPNSDKSRETVEIEPEKRVKKSITNKVHQRKSNRIFDAILEDDIDKLKHYIVYEVLIPNFKRAIDDIVTNGTRMLLYPGSDPQKRSSSTPATRVSYRDYSKPNTVHSVTRTESQVRDRLEYDDLVFDNRGEAEMVLDTMTDIVDQYGVVSIHDLYELAEISTENFEAHKYGWKENIRSAQIIRVRDGYLLKMPRARVIN